MNYNSRALKKLVCDQGDDWDQYLDPVLFSLRTKSQVTTKYSPFKLLYNREAKYPQEMKDMGEKEMVRYTSTLNRWLSMAC